MIKDALGAYIKNKKSESACHYVEMLKLANGPKKCVVW